jgi:ABC-2 type transport system ATP-binding protein
MDEAEQLADRIAVIAGGRIVAEGTPDTLGGRDRMESRISFTLREPFDWAELPAAVRRAEHGAGGLVTVRSRTPLADLRDLADWALEQGADLADLDVRRPALEDVYLELTGVREEA